MPQALGAMYLGAMELQVGFILDHILNKSHGLLESKFANFVETWLVKQEQEVVNS